MLSFTQKFDNLALQCEREHNIINSRITTNASDITLLKSRVTAVEDELNNRIGPWVNFKAEYNKFVEYVGNKFEALDKNFHTFQESLQSLHEEMERLNSKVNSYDDKIQKCIGLVTDCHLRIDKLENQFDELSIETHRFFDTKGHPNGLAPLDENGKIAAQFLPSYVDDVLEYPSFDELPEEGEYGKIYVTLNTNLTYRWSGTQYTEISKSLALGETEFTAFPGDRGVAVEEKLNATTETLLEHIADKANPHEVTKEQLGLSMVDNTADMDKPVSVPQKVAIDDAKKAGTDAQKTIDNHLEDFDNPHKVTKSQVGLSNVDNTSDADKPISNAQLIENSRIKGVLSEHINNKANPHEVTKGQLGLDRVDNTSDMEKPISTAVLEALKTQRDELNAKLEGLTDQSEKITALETKITNLENTIKELLEWKNS